MKTKWNEIDSGTLLLITWHDIVSDPSWLTDEKARSIQPALCKNIGWLINSDKLNIRITSSVSGDGDKNVTIIPKGCIRNVQEIKYKRGK